MASTRLFVGNIPYATTEQELRDLFGRDGAQVASVRIVTDFDTGRSKGYAFIEMATPDEAERVARSLNGFNLGGRSIVVDEAKSRSGSGPRRSGG